MWVGASVDLDLCNNTPLQKRLECIHSEAHNLKNKRE